MSNKPSAMNNHEVQSANHSPFERNLYDQKFVRKQYQNDFVNYLQTKKQSSLNDNVDNYDYLAQVETEKYVPKQNKLNSSTYKGKSIHSESSYSKQNISDKKHVKAKTKKRLSKQISPKKKRINITEHLKELQVIVNNIDTQPRQHIKRKTNTEKGNKTNIKDLDKVGYWQTVYSIESKQGKLLYRPRNKARNCNYTLGPCGHHQLTVQALRDIGCKSLQCRKDRLDYNKSLKFSKQLLALNEKRLKKNGLTNLRDYEKYLIHQQGANGIKNIIAATKGKKELSKVIKKNMANNSPYSYRQLKKMGSKIAAKKFMRHWENKWLSEKRLVLASNTKSTNNQRNTRVIPIFNDNDLNYALNLLF